MVILTAVLFQRDATDADFFAFYDSALTFRTGLASPITFERPDLNPPTLAVVLSPLTVLPPQGAFVVWTVLGLLLMARAIRGTILSTQEPVWWVLGLTLAMPSLTAWQEGQLTWILAAFVTAGWRSTSPVVSGIYVAVAIALKPPLALMALLLPWRVMLTAGCGSLLMTGLAILVTGLEPWLTWLSLADQVNWIGWPYNLSLWGVVARVGSGTLTGLGMDDLPVVGVIVVGAVLLVGAYRVYQTADRDRRWLLALLWSLAASPAGWLYYLPLGIGPLMRVRVNRLLIVALVLWCIPLPLLGPLTVLPSASVLLGSLYAGGLIVAWIGLERATIPACSAGAAPIRSSP